MSFMPVVPVLAVPIQLRPPSQNPPHSWSFSHLTQRLTIIIFMLFQEVRFPTAPRHGLSMLFQALPRRIVIPSLLLVVHPPLSALPADRLREPSNGHGIYRRLRPFIIGIGGTRDLP